VGYSSGYNPDINFINKVIKQEWEDNGLALLGFVHSHPRGVSRLSGDFGNNTGDIGYVKAIFSAIPQLEKFLTPIIYSTFDKGKQEVFPYVVEKGNEENYKKEFLEVIDDPSDFEGTTAINSLVKSFSTEKIEGSVDSNLMSQSHIVIVGVGGAYGICEDLVRTGIGKLTIIDFDTVDNSNLSTQGFYIDDIGKYKVDVIKERLLKINKEVIVNSINANFNELSEDYIYTLIKNSNLLMMMTDDFNAQKRGNLFSLKYKIPALFAIMYERARGAEIVFNIPDITPACFRCAVSPRYKEYDEGYTNKVTSHQSNAFQTHYLNSAIGMIALSIIHRDSVSTELGNWYSNKWEKNLVQLKLSPNYINRLFNNGAFCFDAVWQKIEVERPPKYEYCPDCGGKGNLMETIINHSI